MCWRYEETSPAVPSACFHLAVPMGYQILSKLASQAHTIFSNKLCGKLGPWTDPGQRCWAVKPTEKVISSRTWKPWTGVCCKFRLCFPSMKQTALARCLEIAVVNHLSWEKEKSLEHCRQPKAVLCPHLAVPVLSVGLFLNKPLPLWVCCRLYPHRTEHQELGSPLHGPSAPICSTHSSRSSQGGRRERCMAMAMGLSKLAIMEGDNWQHSQPCQREAGLVLKDVCWKQDQFSGVIKRLQGCLMSSGSEVQ